MAFWEKVKKTAKLAKKKYSEYSDYKKGQSESYKWKSKEVGSMPKNAYLKGVQKGMENVEKEKAQIESLKAQLKSKKRKEQIAKLKQKVQGKPASFGGSAFTGGLNIPQQYNTMPTFSGYVNTGSSFPAETKPSAISKKKPRDGLYYF